MWFATYHTTISCIHPWNLSSLWAPHFQLLYLSLESFILIIEHLTANSVSIPRMCHPCSFCVYFSDASSVSARPVSFASEHGEELRQRPGDKHEPHLHQSTETSQTLSRSKLIHSLVLGQRNLFHFFNNLLNVYVPILRCLHIVIGSSDGQHGFIWISLPSPKHDSDWPGWPPLAPSITIHWN